MHAYCVGEADVQFPIALRKGLSVFQLKMDFLGGYRAFRTGISHLRYSTELRGLDRRSRNCWLGKMFRNSI